MTVGRQLLVVDRKVTEGTVHRLPKHRNQPKANASGVRCVAKQLGLKRSIFQRRAHDGERADG